MSTECYLCDEGPRVDDGDSVAVANVIDDAFHRFGDHDLVDGRTWLHAVWATDGQRGDDLNDRAPIVVASTKVVACGAIATRMCMHPGKGDSKIPWATPKDPNTMIVNMATTNRQQGQAGLAAEPGVAAGPGPRWRSEPGR